MNSSLVLNCQWSKFCVFDAFCAKLYKLLVQLLNIDFKHFFTMCETVNRTMLIPSPINVVLVLCIRGIATSFEGKHGSIRYWLKAEMDKPWSFNHKTKRAFTVISPIDINKPEYQVSFNFTTLCT